MALIELIYCQTFTMFYVRKTHKTDVHKTPLPICQYRLCSYHHLQRDYETRPESHASIKKNNKKNNDIPVFTEYYE